MVGRSVGDAVPETAAEDCTGAGVDDVARGPHATTPNRTQHQTRYTGFPQR
jgi:hypothetical protein